MRGKVLIQSADPWMKKTTDGRKSDTVWWLELKVTACLKIWFLPTWWNGRHKRLKIMCILNLNHENIMTLRITYRW